MSRELTIHKKATSKRNCPTFPLGQAKEIAILKRFDLYESSRLKSSPRHDARVPFPQHHEDKQGKPRERRLEMAEPAACQLSRKVARGWICHRCELPYSGARRPTQGGRTLPHRLRARKSLRREEIKSMIIVTAATSDGRHVAATRHERRLRGCPHPSLGRLAR